MPRRLGQHFLHRQDYLRRIAEAVCEGGCERVIEIGPGRGALTEHLLGRAGQVTAVEVDGELIPRLRERFEAAANFELLHADILETDLTPLMPAVVAGNLPYYIASPIIEKVLWLGPERMRRAVFLIQEEVAERLSAGPGSRDYGYLSVQTQTLAEPRTLFRVPPSAFSPPPKVNSAVVALTPRRKPLAEDAPAFLRFASRCFRQKRKTLRNNLVSVHPAIGEQPEAGLRAEQVPVTQLVDLFGRLSG